MTGIDPKQTVANGYGFSTRLRIRGTPLLNSVRKLAVISAAALTFAAVTTFALLTTRWQGFVVDFVARPNLPYQWGARKHFRVDFTNIQQIRDFLIDNPSIESVQLMRVTETILCKIADSNTHDCAGLDTEQLEKAMRGTSTGYALRSADSLVLHIDRKARHNRYFRIAFLYELMPILDIEDCGSLGELPMNGTCRFSLEAGWYLLYEWTRAVRVD